MEWSAQADPEQTIEGELRRGQHVGKLVEAEPSNPNALAFEDRRGYLGVRAVEAGTDQRVDATAVGSPKNRDHFPSKRRTDPIENDLERLLFERTFVDGFDLGRGENGHRHSWPIARRRSLARSIRCA